MNQTWYSDFFSGIVVEMWRDAVSPEQTRREADYLVRALQLEPGQQVLDVPCGFGRHSIELAGRGMRMTGIDVSDEMIAIARQQSQLSNQEVNWRVAEMRDLNGLGEFEAAFCFGNSFGYLDRKGMSEFLSGVSNVLAVGSRFAFDYGMAAESILPRFIEREWVPVDDMYFLESNVYNVADSCIETTYTFVRDGVAETRKGLHWVYTIAEIRAMLAQAGLNTISIASSLDGEPFELGTPVLYIVCERSIPGTTATYDRGGVL